MLQRKLLHVIIQIIMLRGRRRTRDNSDSNNMSVLLCPKRQHEMHVEHGTNLAKPRSKLRLKRLEQMLLPGLDCVDPATSDDRWTAGGQ